MTVPALFIALFLKPIFVLGGACAVVAVLRRHSSAAKHAVWAGAIIVTLGVPLLTLVLPPLRIVVTATEPISAGDLRLLAVSTGRNESTRSDAAGATPTTTNAPLDESGNRALTAMLLAWLLIAVVLAGRRVQAEIRVRRIVRRSHGVTPRIERLGTDIAGVNGANRRTVLRTTHETASPAVTGVLRPVILLPAAAESWPEADLKPVLVHELGHVRRRDCLLNFLADLTAAVYWCNPLIHFAVRQMRAESERACDDLVLRAGHEPDTYAHMLLRFAAMERMTGALPSGATAMARPSELESRLTAVLDPRLPRAPVPTWMTAAIASLGVLIALPTASLTLEAAPLAPREPDQRGDSLSSPLSERVPLAADVYHLSPETRSALHGPDSMLAASLVTALGHEPAHEGDLVRERAAWALAQSRNGRLIEPLLDALSAADWRVQAYAAWALGVAGESRAVPKLMELLGHPAWRLRAMAAHALSESVDPRAEDAMAAAINDDAWQVRVGVVEYFAALGGVKQSARLRPRLDDRHVAVRVAAKRALTIP